ncbi:MAG: radical SAM protein [Candidatus Coatesbacteria bacterium]|nr:radical SAM protein [Candidatus Coatesbacteria bacterium]
MKVKSYSDLYRKLIGLHAKIPYCISPKKALPPLQAFFEVTYRCNLRCEMCQFNDFFEVNERVAGKSEELSADEIRGIIRQVPRYSLLSFSGGEPFVRPDIIEILEYASRRNTTHIITNGTLVNEEKAKRLAELGANSFGRKGLVLIGVSVHGDEALHDGITRSKGSFEKACRTVEMIRHHRDKLGKKYPLINLKTVITKKTVPFLGYMFELAEKLGADICNLLTMNSALDFYCRLAKLDDMDKIRSWANTPAVPENLDVDLLDKMLKEVEEKAANSRVQLRLSPQGIPRQEMVDFHRDRLNLARYVCYMPWSKVFISAYGDVLICFNQWVGSLRESSLRELWMAPKMMKFREMLKNAGIFPACAGCCQSEYSLR